MKRSVLRFSILFIAIIFLCMSCDKGNMDGQEEIDYGTFSAKIDGKQFTSKFIIAGYVEPILFNYSEFSITGFIGEAPDFTKGTMMLHIYVPVDESVSLGDYNFEGDSCAYGEVMCGFVTYGDLSQSGVGGSTKTENGVFDIEFTSIDFNSGGNVIGTFSGTLVNGDGEMKQLTSGKFDVTIL